jgi:hypothetical protein
MSVPLPPLPNLGPGRTAGRNVVDVLADEHRTLLSLCAQLTDPALSAVRRRRVAEVIVATASRHLSAEEQYLYPAVRAAVPGGEALAAREIAEDRAVLVTLKRWATTSPPAAEFDRLAAAAGTQLRRHAEVAAAEVLPRLLGAATAEDLVRLGNRVETAEEAAPTRPHPSTPSTPPWNKLLEPAIGVLDRLRDAVGRRMTYPDDL